MIGFNAVHCERTHSIKINTNVEKAFKLFTAEGEILWAEGWNPVFYFPESETTLEGSVFSTENNGIKTIWTCIEFDENNSAVKYIRTIPESNTAIVSVKCNFLDENNTMVDVRYNFTSLTESGNDHIERFTEEYYIEFINSWKKEIDEYLESK